MNETLVIMPRCEECGNLIRCKEEHRVWCSQYDYCKTYHSSELCECNVATHCIRLVNYKITLLGKIAFWFLTDADIYSPVAIPSELVWDGYGRCKVKLCRVPIVVAHAAGFGDFPEWLDTIN